MIYDFVEKNISSFKSDPIEYRLFFSIDVGQKSPFTEWLKSILFTSRRSKRGSYVSYEDTRPCRGKTLKTIAFFSVFSYQPDGSHFITPSSLLKGCIYGIFVVTHHKNIAIDSFRLNQLLQGIENKFNLLVIYHLSDEVSQKKLIKQNLMKDLNLYSYEAEGKLTSWKVKVFTQGLPTNSNLKKCELSTAIMKQIWKDINSGSKKSLYVQYVEHEIYRALLQVKATKAKISLVDVLSMIRQMFLTLKQTIDKSDST